MKLIVISPEAHDPRELPALSRLFAAGLAHYHLRKPAWDRARLVAHLRAIPAEFHPHIVLHSHHDLAADFALGVHNATDPSPRAQFRSRAVHTLVALRDLLDAPERLLFSPVFPSISKPGHGPTFDHDELRAALAPPRRAEVIALGGVGATRLADCRALGFDGAAVLGAVWQSPDPVAAFTELLAHAR
jgi:thiamine-phosphate pyrophosphorylase